MFLTVAVEAVLAVEMGSIFGTLAHHKVFIEDLVGDTCLAASVVISIIGLSDRASGTLPILEKWFILRTFNTTLFVSIIVHVELTLFAG